MSALLRTGGHGGGDSWREIRVSLGSDAEVSGRLSFTTATRIEGRLKGEVRSVDLLVVGPQAHVEAKVHAQVLVVLGEIQGDVTCTERLDIRKGGRVFGDVKTRALVIEDGGRLEGSCQMRGVSELEESSPDRS